jgi:hypothetical protein
MPAGTWKLRMKGDVVRLRSLLVIGRVVGIRGEQSPSSDTGPAHTCLREAKGSRNSDTCQSELDAGPVYISFLGSARRAEPSHLTLAVRVLRCVPPATRPPEQAGAPACPGSMQSRCASTRAIDGAPRSSFRRTARGSPARPENRVEKSDDPPPAIHTKEVNFSTNNVPSFPLFAPILGVRDQRAQG